jgi:GT2 family glycosyltransferase
VIPLFGFYNSEGNGTWSKGFNSCLIIPRFFLRDNEIEVIINAHPFTDAFRSCNILLKTSYGHRGKVIINSKGSFKTILKKPFIRRSLRLIVGDFNKTNSKLNTSIINELPTISIILLNHEKSHMSCLAAVGIASSSINVSFEILCLDNGSSQKSVAELKEGIVPLRIIEMNENLSFGLANNYAAREARGKYLIFLNNDAFLDKGTIDEMIQVFHEKLDCRIVGTVLRFPDGTIQEAGATIQFDGHPIRHGRNNPKFKPRKLPRFQPVDYVSGACLMIRKADFLEMGGFDEKYSPAYYEDTDLCMRSLLYGQKVYLASRSNCYHIENATTSTIENGAWATRTAEAHREIFLKDWGAYLESRDSKDLPWHLKETKQMTSDGTD